MLYKTLFRLYLIILTLLTLLSLGINLTINLEYDILQKLKMSGERITPSISLEQLQGKRNLYANLAKQAQSLGERVQAASQQEAALAPDENLGEVGVLQAILREARRNRLPERIAARVERRKEQFARLSTAVQATETHQQIQELAGYLPAERVALAQDAYHRALEPVLPLFSTEPEKAAVTSTSPTTTRTVIVAREAPSLNVAEGEDTEGEKREKPTLIIEGHELNFKGRKVKLTPREQNFLEAIYPTEPAFRAVAEKEGVRSSALRNHILGMDYQETRPTGAILTNLWNKVDQAGATGIFTISGGAQNTTYHPGNYEVRWDKQKPTFYIHGNILYIQGNTIRLTNFERRALVELYMTRSQQTEGVRIPTAQMSEAMLKGEEKTDNFKPFAVISNISDKLKRRNIDDIFKTEGKRGGLIYLPGEWRGVIIGEEKREVVVPQQVRTTPIPTRVTDEPTAPVEAGRAALPAEGTISFANPEAATPARPERRANGAIAAPPRLDVADDPVAAREELANEIELTNPVFYADMRIVCNQFDPNKTSVSDLVHLGIPREFTKRLIQQRSINGNPKSNDLDPTEAALAIWLYNYGIAYRGPNQTTERDDARTFISLLLDIKKATS